MDFFWYIYGYCGSSYLPSTPCSCVWACFWCLHLPYLGITLTFECTAWFLPCDGRYALHGLNYRNSVCLSVTLVDYLHMVRSTIMISSPYGSPIILVSGDIMFIPKFEGDHPERGRWMRVGWVRIGDFRPISRRISETVRDTTKVTIDH